MDKNSIFSQKVIIAFVVGIAIGVGSTWLSLKGPQGDDQAADDADAGLTGTASLGIVLAGENGIFVEDQPAGNKVNINLVIFANPGWVVIHEDDNGVPGNALGAQLFDIGEHTGTVDLLRATEDGKSYYAMLRQDDGDRAFDLTKDFLASDIEGNPVQIKFKATSEPSEE